jgi:hypothetical protein
MAPAAFRSAEILHLPKENIPPELEDLWHFPKDERPRQILPIRSKHK